MDFAKGHGTGNDFVVLPDLAGEFELTPELVRAICDRRHGIGADGVLRVVPSALCREGADHGEGAGWFMDYRNADGSLAEMCGNGVRVYARWLQRAGLIATGELALATRGGIRTVTVPGDGGDITVDMGPPRLTGRPRRVTAAGVARAGLEVWMGNPHVVVEVQDVVDAGSLRDAPSVTPGLDTNVEFVAVRPDRLVMRVHERGVGETQSCGTGACAAAVAVATRAGRDAGRYLVDVPGGRLRVDWSGGTVRLTGPAEIVAAGRLDAAWLDSRLRAEHRSVHPTGASTA